MNGTIHHILQRHLSPEGNRWLEGKLSTIEDQAKPRTFYLAFGACPRFLGKQDIRFSEAEYSSFNAVYPNFAATPWSTDELGRILLMCALPHAENQSILDELFVSADYRELMALYKGLYFLGNAQEFTSRAREGLRTNMVGVFDAIALENPFPAQYLSEEAWNQMVLKAMFMQRPMHRIYRIADRKNQPLAEMFLDYAEERRSAHRPVSPELWRFVEGFVGERALGALQQTVTEGNDLERQAGLKVLVTSDYPPARDWLAGSGHATDDLPSWNAIGRRQAERMV
ncbi:EboA domain-containing protein [Lewinella sp. IMCC34183]|uniref:EboA domain-containing protein n=1 Tax=Lewinella sp. IMCC34183 TaxID=2248762 RepID=UPI000E2505C0|nr:EboA domain-containing protein [Lewinella sp. IMCC34183]